LSVTGTLNLPGFQQSKRCVGITGSCSTDPLSALSWQGRVGQLFLA
jgi:hypothetical protein